MEARRFRVLHVLTTLRIRHRKRKELFPDVQLRRRRKDQQGDDDRHAKTKADELTGQGNKKKRRPSAAKALQQGICVEVFYMQVW